MIGILALILFVLLLVIGGERGAISIMALVGNIAVLWIAIILMAKGFSPLVITILAGAAISYITLVKQNGKNIKTGAAFLAASAVMLALLLAIYLMIWDSKSGGLNEIQAIQDDMLYYNVDIHISMLQVAVCMGLLSTLGAVLDTALAVTSSVYEVGGHRPDLSRKELFHSGIQIGKEIIGTTVNTLLFAYLGESILLFSYIKIGKYTFETVINSKFLFQNASIMLFGAIACAVTVPVAAICISYFVKEETVDP